MLVLAEFFTFVNFLMFTQPQSRSKLFTTHAAIQQLFADVTFRMEFQIRFGQKKFVTPAAREWPLVMIPHVVLQSTRTSKSFVTLVAIERLFLFVDTQMFLQLMFHSELFATHVANECLFARCESSRAYSSSNRSKTACYTRGIGMAFLQYALSSES